MALIDPTWLAGLAATAVWSTLFSLSNRPGIRGWRNLGLLAGYVVGAAMLVSISWRTALATWLVVAITAGLLYFLYEVVAYARTRGTDVASAPRLGVFLHALLLWPIMLPEAVEYLLAEAGLLKPSQGASGT